jgi:molybdate transport system substrate-binding protein
MKSLNDTKVHKIAIANPSLASYGKSTIEVLKRINQYQSVQKKLVIAENISQCSQYLISGNAEIGFTALSLAMSYDMSSKGSYFIVPDRYYTPIEQTCLLIKTPNPTSEAVLFQKFILSAAAKVIWKKYGYGVP